jgi:hypothetical protein
VPDTNLTITFLSPTTVSFPSGTVIDFPSGGTPAVSLLGDQIAVLFPAGTGIEIPGGERLTVELPGNPPLDLSPTNTGGLTVTGLPGQPPVEVGPVTPPMGVTIPELSPPPLELPAGAIVGGILLPGPARVGLRRRSVPRQPRGPFD